MELSDSFIKLKSENSFLSEEFKQDREKMEKLLTLILNKNNDCVVVKTDNEKLKTHFEFIDNIMVVEGVVFLEEAYDLKEYKLIRTDKELFQFLYDNGITIEDYNIRRVYPRLIEFNPEIPKVERDDYIDNFFRFKGELVYRIFIRLELERLKETHTPCFNVFNLLYGKNRNIELVRRGNKSMEDSLSIAQEIADELWEE